MIPSHHAVWYRTTASGLVSEVVSVLATQCEVVTLKFDSLTIADARMCISMAYQTPVDYPQRAIVVVAESFNPEAQHALLKVIEEPPKTTRFIFFVPTAATILPTVWSRVHVMDLGENQEQGSSALFDAFMKQSPAQRFAAIAEYAKQKDSLAWHELLRGLDSLIAAGSIPNSKKKIIHMCRTWLTFKGSSKKMIWEELALTIPPKTG